MRISDGFDHSSLLSQSGTRQPTSASKPCRACSPLNVPPDVVTCTVPPALVKGAGRSLSSTERRLTQSPDDGGLLALSGAVSQ